MLTLIRNGGIPMFFILAFGLTALVSAARSALRPSPSLERFTDAMARATLYASLVGLCADLAAVFHKAPAIAEQEGAPLNLVVLQGLGEATSPAILGFTFLALVTLFAAVASRRQA
jgi:hypothetical protein